MRKVSHIMTFIGVWLLYHFFALLPLCWASPLGGFIARLIGPNLPVSKVARRNLQRVMPERAADHAKIIRGMWDNFGRVFAEYPHAKEIARSQGGAKVEKHNAHYFQAFKDMGKGGIVVTGHLANWEFGTHFTADMGIPLHVVYRPPNNPYVDKLLAKARGGAVSSIVKGAAGARDIIRFLKNKEFIAMLVDQKMNDGISVPFMGLPAMTVAAPVQLAMKLQVPMIMVRCERIKGTHFRWTATLPFIPPKDGDEVEIMTRINEQLAEWVRERPEQWLWVHRRWGKE